MKRVHVYISGFVQGVFFRGRTQEKAASLGLCGWVRNLPDGRVEAVFEGPEGRIDEMLAWCRRGPEGARVGALEIIEEPSAGSFPDFRIRYR